MDDIPRAFFTDGERAALRDESEISDNARRTHLSRIKRKMPKLGDDWEFANEHAPEIAEMMQEQICEPSIEARLDRIEAELALEEDQSVQDRLRRLEEAVFDDE